MGSKSTRMITASDGIVSVFAITSRWAVVGGNYDDLALNQKNVRQDGLYPDKMLILNSLSGRNRFNPDEL